MVKKRPAIVISPHDRLGYNLVHVVPLSTTTPVPVCTHHIPITMPPQLVGFEIWGITIAENCWAKCDIVNTVAFARLDLIPMGKDVAGKRVYSNHRIDVNTLNNIRKAFARKMGIHIDILPSS